MKPIGTIESCYKDKFGIPRQPGLVPAATAKLRLRADLHPEQALQGLDGFSHLWLIWEFHENRTARYHAKVHPPRLEGESRGVFATRSPHRPNPIGLSLVELVRIEGDTLWLAGVDVMDGTPVLDIKPYLPDVEAKPHARAGWTAGTERPELEVSFAIETEEELAAAVARHPGSALREVISQTIRLDPRPELYRDGDDGEGWRRRPNHAFRLHDVDVHFRMTGPRRAEVFKILRLHDEIRPANLRNFGPFDKDSDIRKK